MATAIRSAPQVRDQATGEIRVGQGGRTDDRACRPAGEDGLDGRLPAEPARDLDRRPVPDRGDDRGDDRGMGRHAGPRPVEVNDVQPARTGRRERSATTTGSSP